MGSKTRGTTFAKWVDTRGVRWMLVLCHTNSKSCQILRVVKAVVRRKIQHLWDWSGTAAPAHVAK